MTATTINNLQDAGGEPPLQTRVLLVERRVSDLKEDMTKGFADVRSEQQGNHTELKGLISSIATAQAERSKIPWQAIGVIVGVLGVAGGLVWTPVKERLGEVVEAVHDRPTRTEIVTTLATIGARRDDAQRAMEGRVGRIEGDIDRLQGAVVPRGEIDAHWADQRDRDGTMQRELDALTHPGVPMAPVPYTAGRR